MSDAEEVPKDIKNRPAHLDQDGKQRDKRFLRSKRAKKPILSGFCSLLNVGKHC